MDLLKYRHVIWDWNGTLLADQQLSYDIFVEVFEGIGKSCPTFEGWRNIVHFPISAFYRSFMPEASSEQINSLMVTWAERYESRRSLCELQPGSSEVLNKLKLAGVTQSILSAHTKDELIAAAKERGVLHFFAEIAALQAGHGGESKVQIGTELLTGMEKRFGWKRSDHVIIGDSSHDAEVAEALGIDCILVAQGIFSKSRLNALGFLVFDSLLELA